MSGTSYISGVISGLKTDEILAQLETVAKAPVLQMQTQKATWAAELAAWQAVNSKLLSLKQAAAALALQSGFATKSVTSSNESLVTASVVGAATAGDYSFSVESLATAHRVATQGFSDDDVLVGNGTVEITVGTGETVSIQADGLSLAGLRDAINRSDAGVTAFIVSDGTEGTPYRLVITSDTTGTAGEMNLAVNLSGGTTPVFTETQAAADAEISLGTGLTITRSSNTINDLIPGVTLRLHGYAPGQSVTLSIANDTDALKAKIEDFVAQYNAFVSFVESQWSYDVDSGQTGTLFGKTTLHQIQADLASRISSQISGLPSSLSLLSQVGIRLGNNGTLSLDETKLDDALADDFNGVMKLFTRYGEPSNINVSFVSGTEDTQPSGEAGYAVAITQAATHARVTAGAAQTAPLAADEELTINGVAISLTAGMTQTQVIAAINSSGARVVASATGADGAGSGQYLTLNSATYGENAEVSAVSDQSNSGGGSGIGNLLVTETSAAGESGVGTGAAGLDVVGMINGEAAEGSGQILTSSAGDAEGLQLVITATAAGSYGTVVYTRGATAALDDMLEFLTDSDNSSVQASMDTLQEQIDDIDERITDTEAAVTRKMDRTRQQFNAMEAALAKLQTQGNFLSSQLAQINANWKGA